MVNEYSVIGRLVPLKWAGARTVVKQKFFLTLVLALAAPLSCGIGSAQAGSNNTLRVIQESSPGGQGNSLYVDQSAAFYSSVVGPSDTLELATRELPEGSTDPNLLSTEWPNFQKDSLDSAARQSGSGNRATITMTDSGGETQLLQDNSGTGFLGNTTNITAAGGALGAVLQIGDDNDATLDIESGGTGLIAQKGNRNKGLLSVEPNGNGKLVQTGDGNNYPLLVKQNTNVIVTQNGTNLQPVGAAAMQVFSTNPGTVTITQTGF